MRDLYTHLRNIYLITRTLEQRLALLPQPERRLPSFGQLLRTGRHRLRRQIVDGFKFVDGEIHPLSNRVFRDQPRRLMRVFLHAQQRGLQLHPDLAQLIRNQLALVDRAFPSRRARARNLPGDPEPARQRGADSARHARSRACSANTSRNSAS